MEKSNNPISIRSRQMITNAFMQLLKEKSYEEITVTDIAERLSWFVKLFIEILQERMKLLSAI